MKDKQIKSLLIILVILGGLWFGQTVISRRNQNQYSTEGKLDLAAKESEIKKIEINFTGTPIAMEKRDNIWFVQTDKPLGEDRAKESDITTLLSMLEPNDVKLVSTNQNKHKDLGLEQPDSAVVKFYLELQGTEPKITLFVSKQNPKLFRQSDMTNVYEWSGDLSRIIMQDLNTWVAPTPTINPEASSSSQPM